MNNIHQVIFNKATQQFVVVSELAKSAGKPKAVSAGSVDIVSILQNFSEKRPLGTTDTQTNRSDNKSSSWSVGAFIGKSQESSGLGVEGAVNVGKGYANSDSKVQNLTEINSDSLSIKTKETTTLKGAVANINHLALETKNLHIESVQDTEKYDSNQSQVSGSGSLALGANGLNGGVSAQFSQNKANVDYAKVAQQSGFNIQESSKINVTENTHLKGSIINAQGDKANHQMTTGTLTTEEIENRSDIKVSSVSVGVSSDNTKMATMAVGAALSALGNMRESERSQTKAAISDNINLSITDSETQKQKTGKTAEETIASLNRDTANANQAVEKADLSAIQEKQETAQIIGELSQSWINRLVQPHLEEANKKRQEAEQLEKSDPLKSAQLKAEAQAIEAEYGLGSNLQMGVRAATAALQGLATGNTNQAAVGLLSPYANKLIKEQTTNADGSINKEANLMAHAVLGALEAHITGNNAAAGALGALTAEAAAPYLMQALYNTDKAENLTDSQKQNIANLSQIAAGLAGGVTGDSTTDFISGAEIGKRAVENNLLLADYSELKGLTKTETEKHRKTMQLLKDNGIENIDDYAKYYSQCSTEQCKKDSLEALNKTFDKAYDKIDELAKSGKLTRDDINDIDEYTSRIRSAYDSKRFSDNNSGDVYFGGLVNVLGKNEDRLNQARLYATVSGWALQGYSQEQIENKLSAENLAVILSSVSVSLSKQSAGSTKIPVVTKQQIGEIVKGTVSISRAKYPETTSHIEDSIKQGKPSVLTMDRKGAEQRRKEALKDTPTKTGYDRDEYPPAMFKEGGDGASVRYISPKDNRGAGSCIGHQCKQYTDGDKVKIEIKD